MKCEVCIQQESYSGRVINGGDEEWSCDHGAEELYSYWHALHSSYAYSEREEAALHGAK